MLLMLFDACCGPVLRAVQSTEVAQISSHGARNDEILTQNAQVGKSWPELLPTEREDHFQSKLLEQWNGHSNMNVFRVTWA